MEMSWERLILLAKAHQRLDALTMFRTMVAAQGNNDSWNNQIEMLRKLIAE